MIDQPRARVTMWIEASPLDVFDAFVEPARLAAFWLSKADAPLAVGRTVRWRFMVEGAEARATATVTERGKRLAWDWGESHVDIALEPFDGGTAVTLVNDRFNQPGMTPVESALNATEGFAIVLCDLKTLLESGKSAGLTKGKARLIEARSAPSGG